MVFQFQYPQTKKRPDWWSSAGEWADYHVNRDWFPFMVVLDGPLRSFARGAGDEIRATPRATEGCDGIVIGVAGPICDASLVPPGSIVIWSFNVERQWVIGAQIDVETAKAMTNRLQDAISYAQGVIDRPAGL